jgi:hypothetical protein
MTTAKATADLKAAAAAHFAGAVTGSGATSAVDLTAGFP